MKGKSIPTKMKMRADILQLLSERESGKTICPSEILPPNLKQDRLVMAQVREVAQDLVRLGKIEITQRGQVVALGFIKGPIRLRLKE